jgi:hypothetical protein
MNHKACLIPLCLAAAGAGWAQDSTTSSAPASPTATPVASAPAPAVVTAPAAPTTSAAQVPEAASDKGASAAASAPAAAATAKPAAPSPSVASSEASSSNSANIAGAENSVTGSSGDAGVQFHPGLSFGTVTVDGKTWTRLSLQPEIEIGKLGVALDIEMFLDDKQNLSDRGWDFNTTQNGLESVLRKIYYVRWDHPGAPFYAKLGALDDVTMAHGLVVNGYRNTARYPDDKLLGLHTQLNDIGALGWNAELLINSAQDFSKSGPFWAAQLGLRPLKPTGMPFLKDLLVGGGVARDESQYSGLRDRDGDGVPDVIDVDPNDASRSVKDMSYLINDPSVIPDDATAKQARQKIADTTSYIKDSISAAYSRKMSFSEMWLSATLPLIQTKFLTWGIYSEFAKPFTPDDDSVASLGWGSIPVGSWANIGPVRLTAEYRHFKGPFQPGWFDANYELDRASLSGGSIKTKTELVYAKDASTTDLNGYFAGVGVDLWGLLDVSGDYSQLIASDNSPDQRSISGKVALGTTITSLLRNKISKAELYWRKDRIGLDSWTDVNGAPHKDGFFDNSIYTTYGWRVGSQAAGGVELIVQRETTFYRDAAGDLKSETQMSVASQVHF